MKKLSISEEELKILSKERYYNEHPRVRQKMNALYLLSHGLKMEETARLAGIDRNTLRNYKNEYIEGGLESIKQTNFNKPKSELKFFEQEIREEFEVAPPQSLKEASERIFKLTCVKRGKTQIRNFLKKIGLKYLKTGFVPGKTDPKKQEEYKKNSRTSDK